MKKVLVILLVLAMALSSIALVACGEPEETLAVSFYDLEGNLLDTVEPVNGKVTPPSTAKDGMSFVGWFADVDGTVDLDGTPVDFSNFAVTESMSVYGSWTELTVTFRYVSGKAISEVKVVDGKITAPTLTIADGFMFDAWYYGKTTVAADGSYTFALTEKWDGSVPSDSTELYANILDLQGSGAYHVTGGVVSGAQYWNWDIDLEANPEYAMVYDADSFTYSQDIVINAGGFRILDTTVGAWCSTFNASHVSEVTVADGVTLPSGYTASFGDGAGDLFSNEGGDDQNIVLASTGYQFELTVILNVGLKTVDIHITKVTELKDPVWALVGTGADVFGDETWKEMETDMNENAIMSQADGKATNTAIFADGGEFKVVDGVIGWGSDTTNVTSVTAADGVVIPDELTAEDIVYVPDGGNIKVEAGYNTTIVVTYDLSSGEISIVISAISKNLDAVDEFGTAVVGNIYDGACGGYWFQGTNSQKEEGLFDVDADGVATGTIFLTNGNQFKVMPDTEAGWVGDIGYSADNAVVTFAQGIDEIDGFLVDAGGNYGVVMPEGKVATVVVTYSAEGVVSFHVTEINDIPTYILVGGGVADGELNFGLATRFDNTASANTLIDDKGELVEWTLSGVGIFKIMQTDDADWSTALGYSYNHKVVLGEGVAYPEGTTEETFLTDDGNFKMGIEGYTTVFTIDYDMVGDIITINIVSITAEVAA